MNRFERAVNWLVDVALDFGLVVLGGWFLMFATAALEHPVGYGHALLAFIFLYAVAELGFMRHGLNEDRRRERKARKAARR